MTGSEAAAAIQEVLDARDSGWLDTLIDALAPYGEAGGPRPWLPLLLSPSAELDEAWKAAVVAVTPLLDDNSLITRSKALKVLARIPTEASAEAAVAGLRDEMPFCVAEALDTICRGADAEAADVLVEMLNHEDVVVRYRAAGNLGLMGNHHVVDALVEVIGDAGEDDMVRSWAATSLGELATTELLERLPDLARQWPPAAVVGLRRGLDRLVQPSRDDLRIDRPAARRLRAARALIDEEPLALEVLLELYTDLEVGLETRSVLLALGAGRLEGLLSVLEGDSDRVAAAADVAGQARLDNAVPLLRTLVEGRAAPGLALLASIALARIQGAPGLAELRRWWAELDVDERVDAREGALFANGALPLPVTLMPLEDPCALVSAAGAELLRRTPSSPVAIQALTSALERELQRVRGLVPPRPPAEAGPIGTPQFIDDYVESTELIRHGLPDELHEEYVELERQAAQSPEVIAARSLLWAMVEVGEHEDDAFTPWMQVGDGLLRIDALRVWAALNPVGSPPGDMRADPEPVARAVYALMEA